MSKLLKSKFLLGIMLVAVLVAGAVALAPKANAQQAIVTASDIQYAATVRAGSSGQAALIWQRFFNGYSTTAQLVEDGKFGPLSEVQAKAWQGSRGLVADGVLGAMSRAAAIAQINAGAPASAFPAGCTSTVGFSSVTGIPCNSASSLPAGCTSSVGFSPTTGASCSSVVTTLPAGCTSTSAFSSTTGASCSTGVVGPIISSNGEGSITVTYDGAPTDNLAVNRGETKAVIGIKVKATGSDMRVTRLWLDINTRMWLSADSVSLLDGSTVIATLPLSASTVTEVTAGSAWQLQFNSLNFVVPVGTTKVLTVQVTRPTATAADATVTVAATSTLRAIDMAGISDTYVLPSARLLNMAAVAGAVGTLTNTLGASSPVAQSVSGLSSTSGTLTPVKLMDFDLKATSGIVNVSEITGTITTSGTCTAPQCYSSLELRDGATVLSSVSGAAGTFDFTTLNINVPQDGTKALSIYAQVNWVADSYVVANDSLVAVVTRVIGTSGPSYTAANAEPDVTGYAQHLFKYAPTLAMVSQTANQVDESTSGTVNKSGNYTLVFNVTAPAGSDIFVDTASTIKVQAYTATPSVAGFSKFDATYGGTLVTSSTVSGASSKGSTAILFDKVAAGTTRTFTVQGYIPHGNTTSGYAGMRMAAIAWTATDSYTTGYTTQTWGLGDFKTNTAYVTTP